MLQAQIVSDLMAPKSLSNNGMIEHDFERLPNLNIGRPMAL